MSKFGTGTGEGAAMKHRLSTPEHSPSGPPPQTQGQAALDSKGPKAAHPSTWC